MGGITSVSRQMGSAVRNLVSVFNRVWTLSIALGCVGCATFFLSTYREAADYAALAVEALLIAVSVAALVYKFPRRMGAETFPGSQTFWVVSMWSAFVLWLLLLATSATDWRKVTAVIYLLAHTAVLAEVLRILRTIWNVSKIETRKLLMLGLDAGGKSTILYKLKFPDQVFRIPSTQGFNVENIRIGRLSFTIWDCGSADKGRALWPYYFPDVSALVYVIDSSDRERLEEAAEWFRFVVNHEHSKDFLFLIFANKRDLPGAMDRSEIIAALQLESLRKIEWHLQETNGLTGQGLYEGLQWLEQRL